MAHYCKLGTGNIVEQTVVVANGVITDKFGVEHEHLGEQFLQETFKSRDIWKQTSYNTRGGIHQLGGTPFRKNFAGVGYYYDFDRDAFIPIKPFNSWILNETTCRWEAPVAYPDDDNNYNWNETNQNWDIVE
mgnify:FL=1